MFVMQSVSCNNAEKIDLKHEIPDKKTLICLLMKV